MEQHPKQYTYIIRWSTNRYVWSKHLKVGRGLLHNISDRLVELPGDANVLRLYDRVPVSYLKEHLEDSSGIYAETESATPSVTYIVYRKEHLSRSLRRLDIHLAQHGILPVIPKRYMWEPSRTSGLLEDDVLAVLTALSALRASNAELEDWIKALRAKHQRLLSARLEKERKEREALVTRAFQAENELLASVFLKPGQG